MKFKYYRLLPPTFLFLSMARGKSLRKLCTRFWNFKIPQIFQRFLDFLQDFQTFFETFSDSKTFEIFKDFGDLGRFFKGLKEL